jgi:hypothetical protein
MLVKKFSDHSPLIFTIWGQRVAPGRTNHYFDTSLPWEKESRMTMLLAWEGDSQRLSDDSDWATWLEVVMGKVMRYNA